MLAFAVLLAVVVAIHPAPFGVDRAWATVTSTIGGEWLTSVAKDVFDPLGRFPLSWLIVAIAGAVLWRERRRGAMVVLLIGELASWATNSLIKAAVDRPRPPDALIEATRSSFPSGHAAFAAVTAILLVGLLAPIGRRTGPTVLAAALAVAMAWTRTDVHVHWLTDVIGGLCVGLGVGSLTLAWATATDQRGLYAVDDPSTLSR
jgi:membrane-associated phospholipid phosphatase